MKKNLVIVNVLIVNLLCLMSCQGQKGDIGPTGMSIHDTIFVSSTQLPIVNIKWENNKNIYFFYDLYITPKFWVNSDSNMILTPGMQVYQPELKNPDDTTINSIVYSIFYKNELFVDSLFIPKMLSSPTCNGIILDSAISMRSNLPIQSIDTITSPNKSYLFSWQSDADFYKISVIIRPDSGSPKSQTFWQKEPSITINEQIKSTVSIAIIMHKGNSYAPGKGPDETTNNLAIFKSIIFDYGYHVGYHMFYAK